MLINLSDFIKRESLTAQTYLGVVVDNADPKKLGRVKCKIDGLLEGDTSKLPWIMQRSAAALGGGSNTGSFFVPQLNTQLEIEFPFDDIYCGEYVGFWQSSDTHPTDFDGNYPNQYGFTDGQIKVVVDKEKQEAKIEMGNGIKITVSDDGKIEVESPTAVTLKAPEVIFNEKISAVTTVNSHFGVVDFITGITVQPSLTTFGDV
jgi:hypothetical protein